MKQEVRGLFGYLVTSYLGGILFIILGWFLIKDMIKSPNKDYFPNIRGWVTSVGFFLFGIYIVIAKLLGKL